MDKKLEIVLTAKNVMGPAFTAAKGQVAGFSSSAERKFHALRKAVFSLQGAFLALGGTYGLVKVGESFWAAGLKADKLDRALKAATGSSEAAAEAQRFLARESDRLGLVLVDQVDAFGKLTAAANGTKIEGEGVRQVYLGMAEASTALQLSADDTHGAMKAVEQMISKGKVSAEELRQQLGERLPGAFQIAARAMGVTAGELDDMLKKGQVVSDEFLPRFARALREQYGKAAEDASRGAQSAVNRLKNTWFELRRTVMEGGAMDVIVEQLTAFNDEIKSILQTDPDAVRRWGETVASGLSAIANALATIGKYAGLRSVTTTALQGIDLAAKGYFDEDAFREATFIERQRMVDEALQKEAHGGRPFVSGKIGTPPWNEKKTSPAPTSTIVPPAAADREGEKWQRGLDEVVLESVYNRWVGLERSMYEADIQTIADIDRAQREAAEAQLAIRRDLTDEIMYLTLSETDYRKWALDEEVRALKQKAGADLETLSVIEAYHAAAYAGILEDVEGQYSAMVELSQRTAEAIEQNFSDLFFDVMTGEFDSLVDYAKAALRSIQRATADILGQMAKDMIFGGGGAGKGSMWSSLLSWGTAVGAEQLSTGAIVNPSGAVWHFAEGGTLYEPVVGRGQRTGGVYTFAEYEPEDFTPRSKRASGGGGSLTISVPVQIQENVGARRAAELQREVEETCRRVIKDWM